jgi:hypothetical protein
VLSSTGQLWRRLDTRGGRVGRVAAGNYGRVTVDWQASNREVIDIDEVEKVVRALGKPVPYRTCSDSLRVTLAPEPA